MMNMMNEVQPPNEECKQKADNLKLFALLMITLGIVKLIAIPGENTAFTDIILSLVLFCAANSYN